MSRTSSYSSSPSLEKPWFQDTKTGCEKQAHYFLQIRKLQDELIHREQHNLINAMERLKQITYPRKRPMIRNFETSDPSQAQNFPARNINLRKEAKHKALRAKEKPELSPVSGKPLMSKPGNKKQQHNYHHFSVMPPLLSDKDIAKIVHHANATLPSEPSTYLLQPHLPSIPNVGRKTNFMVDNRLKLLTLADQSEFCDLEEASVSGTRKHLHTGKSQRRKRSPKSNSRLDSNVSKESQSKKNGSNVLTFDVDPNDPSLFLHCVEDKKEEEHYETTPLPPPNSRPGSAKSKSSNVMVAPETLKESEDVNEESDNNTKTETEDDDDVVAPVKEKMTDSRTEDGKIDVNPDGEEVNDDNDLSSLAPPKVIIITEGGSGNISDNQEAFENVQPAVTITNKQAASQKEEN